MSGSTTASADSTRLALATWLRAKAKRGAVVLSPQAARELAEYVIPTKEDRIRRK
jgi:hypothetical protein